MFEEMLTAAANDSAHIKALIKNAPDHEWDHMIIQANMTMGRKTSDRDDIDNQLTKKRNKLQDLTVSLATHKDKDMVTSEDVEMQATKLAKAHARLETLQADQEVAEQQCHDIGLKIEKIEQVKEQFPVDELRERLSTQLDLEASLKDLEHSHKTEKTLLQIQEKSVAKLDEVPCGDQFPTCKYIKDAHKNKKLLGKQKDKTTALLDGVRAARKSLKILVKEGLIDKLERYDAILTQGTRLKVEASEKAVELHSLETDVNTTTVIVADAEKLLNDMKLRVSDGEVAEEISHMKKMMNELSSDITELDSRRMSISESIGLLTNEIGRLEKERDEFKDLMSQWRIYELFMNAVSKKGIPLQIITSQLPIINKEISKILQDVVGFTVELEAESNSNAMDIFINYGDSRRIIECGSGMEKMMASLAIRVALINISSLPKTNLLVIDEGFGALDEMNVESCNRLLKSLKRWFRNILVISHVDGVKDIVDVVLDIRQHGKNSMIQCAGAEALSG